MATTLTDAVDKDTNTFIVSDDDLIDPSSLPAMLQIDSEKFYVVGHGAVGEWHVDRGIAGSRRSDHSAGATISFVWSSEAP